VEVGSEAASGSHRIDSLIDMDIANIRFISICKEGMILVLLIFGLKSIGSAKGEQDPIAICSGVAETRPRQLDATATRRCIIYITRA